MSLETFHPVVHDWFKQTFPAPTDVQSAAWPVIRERRPTLIAAPTGSGKTLAAFLAAIDELVRQNEAGLLADETQVVYVSPLKALSNDIQRNLQDPLRGVQRLLRARGVDAGEIRVMVRTGDTPQSQRQAMIRRPPHLVVTTPESLYILLTSESGRRMLETAGTLIVDEIHALVGNKRGSHLALSMERLQALCKRPLVRIGLSATQKPMSEVARFLSPEECTVIDTGHRRQLDIGIELPDSPLEAVMAAEVWEELHDRLTQLIEQHRTTLIFVNTRRLSERLTKNLSERIGKENVTSHHGSLSKEHRLKAEQALKSGKLRALVATASLELGIDIGDVDLVCQMGSTRSISAFLQRVGRSGHGVGRTPKGRLFPLSRDELVECVALLDAVHRGELDRLSIPQQPLDILAQQIVAAVAAGEWQEDALFDLVRRAYPYQKLERRTFDDVIQMLAEGFSTQRGRRGAYLHHDAVNGRLRARRGARLAAITSGGAIPDTADYQVILEPGDTFVGTVNEDFAIESMPGDIFQLGNMAWQIRRVEPGKVRVEDARGKPPTMPFWLGEAPSRSFELSRAVSRLRQQVVEDPSWLGQELRLGGEVVGTLTEYLGAAKAALGVMPTQSTIVLERFFDDAGGMQLVVHSPYGSRLNRAWGLALRKRFCRKFNIELQAAANEDAIVLSLGPTHSFALDEVRHYLNSRTVRDVLVQALLDAPMFGVRWRWNATRSLALLRFRGGRKVAPQLTRMQAEDLLSLVFPDQVACFENLPGERDIPDHPLVRQTIEDCLSEAMDIDRFEKLLRDIEAGSIAVIGRDLHEPSPLAHEILNARPYAFLDDAPLEERRTQAVQSRRWSDPKEAAELGALDAEAIQRVQEELAPRIENIDELHDTLVIWGCLLDGEWQGPSAEALVQERRATALTTARGGKLWIAAERLPEWQALRPEYDFDPNVTAPPRFQRHWSPEEALVEIVRGRLESTGPVTVSRLSEILGFSAARLQAALAALETQGFVIRGHFTPQAQEEEWCERRILARIHRYTLKRLRSEIEPVAMTDFLRFLFEWQGLVEDRRMEGTAGVSRVLEQLEGFAMAAAAWESDVLPSRLRQYDPAWLDSLCMSGRVVWLRRGAPKNGGKTASPIRTTPIAILQRQSQEHWCATPQDVPLSAAAQQVLETLRRNGASFFQDIVTTSGLLLTQVEAALAELVATAHVTSDAFTGLRALLVPSDRRKPLRSGARHRRSTVSFGLADAGRWSLVETSAARPAASPWDEDPRAEYVAQRLLSRYGVVFRKLLEREADLPRWRDLVRVFRRLEARGDIRGGRFVNGVTGEQYALPSAVASLRKVRRQSKDGICVTVSAADPLNLVGILTPGPRIAAHPDNRVLFRDGEPVAWRVARQTSFATSAEPSWELEKTLHERQISPRLRAYLKHL